MSDNHTIIEAVTGIIYFFLYTSIFFVFLLWVFKKVVLYTEKKLNEKKNDYIETFSAFFFGFETEIAISSDRDLTAASLAMGELIGFLDHAEKKKAIDMAQSYALDMFLKKKYEKSFFIFHKIFYLILLVKLNSDRMKPFFIALLEDQRMPYSLKRHALLGLSVLTETVEDLQRIKYYLQQAYEKYYASLKLCEHIAGSAIHSCKKSIVVEFFEDISSLEEERSESVRFFLAGAAYEEFIYLKNTLIEIQNQYDEDTTLNVTVLRSLHKMGVKECALVESLWLTSDTITKITLARIGLTLCPSIDMRKIIAYIFDANYYVRRNIFRSIKEASISRVQIIREIERIMPEKLNDPLFLAFMKSYSTEM